MSACVVLHRSYSGAHDHVRREWIKRFGPLDTSDYLCHLCGNGLCVNLRHVYPGNARTNMNDTVRMGRHAGGSATHCPSGHEYTPENTRIKPAGWRECRECNKLRLRRLRRERRS